MKKLILLALIALAGWKWFSNSQHSENDPEALLEPEETLQAAGPSSNNFSCDGRTHCSQMTSCEEATYFLENCPGTKMDGNLDGVPCEKQWCN